MTSVEKQLNALEAEVKAQKMAYEQAATSMPVFTASVDFTTTRNEITTRSSSGNYTENGVERVMVTLDTDTGINTIATLEMETNNTNSAPTIRRVSYSGGARWVVTNQPRVNLGDLQDNNWYPTHYRFQVQSLVQGSLRAENISS